MLKRASDSFDGGHQPCAPIGSHKASAAVEPLSDDHIAGVLAGHVSHVVANPIVDGGQGAYDGHAIQGCAAVIDEIIPMWRQRQQWHRAEKSLTLQAKAVCRGFTDGDKDQANKLFAAATTAIVPDGHLPSVAAAIAIDPLIFARDHIKENRKRVEKHLAKLATGLPVWEAWGKDTKGFGALSLAMIVGECGDLNDYAKTSRLWKRMGLAVIEGERQRRKSGEYEALLHGYSPRRRAVAWVIGDTLVKAQVRKVKDENGKDTGERIALGKYGALYLKRKLIEADRVGTAAHAHNRAARYMVKRLLRHLHVAWRGEGLNP